MRINRKLDKYASGNLNVCGIAVFVKCSELGELKICQNSSSLTYISTFYVYKTSRKAVFPQFFGKSVFNFILVLRGSVAALKSLVACTLIFFLFLSLFGFVCM